MMQLGHGVSSIPEQVMRTGVILPFAANRVRQDINANRVLDFTAEVTGRPIPAPEPEPTPPLPPALPSPTTSAVAATTQATPPTPVPTNVQAPVALHPMGRHFNGAAPAGQLGQWRGRPVATFEIAASPPAGGAHAAAAALKRAAQHLRQAGLGTLPPELIAGPLSALMRGGAVELRFQNGVKVMTAV